MNEGVKVMLTMYLPIVIAIGVGLKYIHYSEKVVKENRKKGVPVQWK